MSTRLGTRAVLIVVGVLFGSPSRAADDPSEIAAHEKALKDARLGVDGPGLLEVFRSRTLSDTDRTRLDEMAERLGDRSFQVREKATRDLIKAGRSAVPHLEKARASTDVEVRRRAERAIDEIQNQNSEAPVLLGAAHLLAVRKPAEATETLLAYLPSASDDMVIEAVHTALGKVGVVNGKPAPAVLRALSDKEVSRRVGAAYAIGKADTAELKALKPLLKDAAPSVRLQAAQSLVYGGDPTGVAALIGLLGEAPLPLASQAEDTLFRLAEDKAPRTNLHGSDEDRRKCRQEWEGWWKANGAQVNLKKLNLEDAYLGYTLICEAHLPNGQGRVFERGRDGKNRWEVAIYNPIDVEYLPGDRLLVANCNNNEVVEMDLKGKVLWRHQVSSPVSVQRLPNGNTFIGTYQGVLEVTREGKVLYNHQRNKDGSLYFAQRQKTGNIWCIHGNGRLVEIDAAGKELLSLNVGGTGIWGDVQQLPNGRLLVAKSSSNEVVEIDRTGKVLWQCSIRNPLAAVRLRNGNTIATSYTDHTVVEFDRNGKEVSKIQLQGLPFRARRR